MHFSALHVYRKVVDNGLIYLPVQFQLNLTFQTRENGQKPSKMAKNPQKWPKMAKNLLKMTFSDLGVNTKSVSIGLN